MLWPLYHTLTTWVYTWIGYTNLQICHTKAYDFTPCFILQQKLDMDRQGMRSMAVISSDLLNCDFI